MVAGAAILVIQATVIGLAANALHPDRLPLKRVPLRETRRVATPGEVLPPVSTVAAVPEPADSEPADPTAKDIPSKRADAPPPSPVPTPPPDTLPAIRPTVEKPQPTPVAPQKAPPAAKPAARPKPLPKPAEALPKPSPPKVEALFTTLDDARSLFDRGDTVFVDARHREDFDVEHIAGARSVFVGDVDGLYEGVLGDLPKDRTIVTYCSDPQCGTAIELADALVARGHTRVFILLEGMPGWKDAGYPTEAGGAP